MLKEIKGKEDFNKELEMTEKVLVDFNANWCGPCQMLKPLMEELSKDYKVLSINVDDNNELANEFGIRSIPSVILFENKKEVNRLVGLRSKDEYINLLK